MRGRLSWVGKIDTQWAYDVKSTSLWRLILCHSFVAPMSQICWYVTFTWRRRTTSKRHKSAMSKILVRRFRWNFFEMLSVREWRHCNITLRCNIATNIESQSVVLVTSHFVRNDVTERNILVQWRQYDVLSTNCNRLMICIYDKRKTKLPPPKKFLEQSQ